MRDSIRYRRDPVAVELVQDAQRTIETGAGDGDDKVVALCSLLCVAGYVTRFVCGGRRPDVLDHVWCEVYLDGEDRWRALDPTNEEAAPGWFQTFPYRLDYEIFTDEAGSPTALIALILLARITAKGRYA